MKKIIQDPWINIKWQEGDENEVGTNGVTVHALLEIAYFRASKDLGLSPEICERIMSLANEFEPFGK